MNPREPLDQLIRSEQVDHVVPGNFVSEAWEKSNISMREIATISLLVLFGITVLATYTLIFLWGFRRILLPQSFANWLGGATIGQAASLLAIVVRDLFPAGRKGNEPR